MKQAVTCERQHGKLCQEECVAVLNAVQRRNLNLEHTIIASCAIPAVLFCVAFCPQLNPDQESIQGCAALCADAHLSMPCIGCAWRAEQLNESLLAAGCLYRN